MMASCAWGGMPPEAEGMEMKTGMGGERGTRKTGRGEKRVLPAPGWIPVFVLI